MTPYILAKKFINAKVLLQEEIAKRVNTFYMFNQLNQEEYEELMELINIKYGE